MTLQITGIPSTLSDKLVEEYVEIKRRFTMNDWGPGQLKGGRFSEVVLRIFQHLLGETTTPFGTDIVNTEKTRIINTVTRNSAIDKHVRQKMTALTRLLLDFRNNRDAAHLNDFNANSMDTAFVHTSATWIVCELVRVYGGYPMQEAQKIVDSLAVKDYPVIMEFEGELFITRDNLTAKEEILVWLSKIQKMDYRLLHSKTRDKNNSRFKKTLKGITSSKLIGEKDGLYFIMPLGIDKVRIDRLLEFHH